MDALLNVEQKSNLGRLAAKEFLQITDRWKLTDDQRRILAGAATRTTISTWRKRVSSQSVLQLGQDTYERILCIKAIENQLVNLCPHNADQYIRHPLDELYDHSLLDIMLNGRVIDLYATEQATRSLSH